MKKVVHRRKPHLVLVLFLLLTGFFVTVKAQSSGPWPGFASELRHDSGGSYPSAVTADDFNRDGIPDIAVAGYDAEQQVSVLLGNGDGTFQEAISQSINTFADAITTADLNADGKIDLVVGSSSNASYAIKVLFGNGDGSLQPAVSYPIYGLPQAVIIDDFNQDNHPDVAFIDNRGIQGAGASGIGILLNKGDGTFLSPTTYLAGLTGGLASGDFNGDGKLDLVTVEWATNDPSVIVLPGNGDGTFKAAMRFSVPGRSLIAAHDFDRDGKLDVAVANTTGGVTILPGQGDGTFRIGDSHDLVDSATAGAVGDFNGDGEADIVVTATASGGLLGNFTVVLGSIHVLLGNGDSTFQSPLTFDVGLFPFSLAVADFNVDNAPDLVIGHRTSTTFISVLLNSVINREPCEKTDAATVLTDSTGDTRYGIPSHDIQSVSISEKTSASGEPLLVITLKVAELNVITPTTIWQVTFSGPFGGGGAFQLRSGEHSELSTTSGLDPESGSSQDGSIRFVVSKRKLDRVAGETITNIKAQVYRWGGEVNDYDDWAPNDFNAPSPASYTLGGNNPCGPQLLTEPDSDRAVALDSVTFVRDPFSFTSTTNFSSDQRTRIILFALNIDLEPGEDASTVTAHAENSQHATFSFPVEFVSKVPKFSGLTQINARLPDDFANGGDYFVSVTYHGLESNKALITIKLPGS